MTDDGYRAKVKQGAKMVVCAPFVWIAGLGLWASVWTGLVWLTWGAVKGRLDLLAAVATKDITPLGAFLGILSPFARKRYRGPYEHAVACGKGRICRDCLFKVYGLCVVVMAAMAVA